jgi:hypothetical protein
MAMQIRLPSIMLFKAGNRIHPFLEDAASLLDILAILASADIIEKNPLRRLSGHSPREASAVFSGRQDGMVLDGLHGVYTPSAGKLFFVPQTRQKLLRASAPIPQSGLPCFLEICQLRHRESGVTTLIDRART